LVRIHCSVCIINSLLAATVCAVEEGLREGATEGTSYPSTRGAGAQEDESTQVKFFCNQAQIY